MNKEARGSDAERLERARERERERGRERERERTMCWNEMKSETFWEEEFKTQDLNNEYLGC